jgi:FMN-dependent NADH-azoreductase
MASILHIDSSPRGDRSSSRTLSKDFVTAWQALHPDEAIIYRDLRHTPVPHITEEWIEADFMPPEKMTSQMVEALKVSDELVDEFLAADRCVFSVPMHNFSIPSNFKAYIDQIVRVGRTFVIEDGQFKGLATNKKVLFITARGATYDAGSPFEGWDCQEPALRYAFQFMGVTDIEFVHANGLDLGDEIRQQALDDAKSQLNQLVTRW